MSETQQNFIKASLCDNDFGHSLKRALDTGHIQHGDMCLISWKNYIIAFVISVELLRHTTEIDWERLKSLEDYLRSKLKVTYERYPPSEDDDRGSACLDIHSGAAWLY